MGSITLRGSLEVSGSCVSGCSTGSSDRHVLALAFSECGSRIFDAIVEAPSVRIATAGAVGQAWEDLGVLESLSQIELLFLQVLYGAQAMIRIGAAPAELLGAGGVFPSGFGGGETLNVTIDGTALAVVFDVADQSAAQVAARINATAALAGLTHMPASVDASGQLLLTGVLTGAQGAIAITGGSGAAAIGYAGTPSAAGEGADVSLQGIYLAEFWRYPDAPTRVQISGNATIKLLAAGRSAA